MRKLLSLMGTIGLVVTPMASMATSCSKIEVPVFDPNGDVNQFSDNWNFTYMKTVSLFSKIETPDSGPDETIVKDGESTNYLPKINKQVVRLLAGRFANGADFKTYFGDSQGSKITITYYESNNSNESEIEKPEEFFGRMYKELSSDFFKEKIIYFKVKNKSNDKPESDFMDLKLSMKPTVNDFADFISSYHDNKDSSIGINLDNTYFAWRKNYYKFDSENKDEKNKIQYVAQDFTAYSKIEINYKSYWMRDVFLEQYADIGSSYIFEVTTFEKVIQSNISIDDSANVSVNFGKDTTIQIHNYI